MDPQFTLDDDGDDVRFALAGAPVDRSICINNRRQPDKTKQAFSSRKSKFVKICSKNRAVILLMLIVALILAALFVFLRKPVHPAMQSIDGSDKNQSINTNQSNSSSSTECDPNFPWKNIRLPTYLRPLQYTLHVQPDLDEGSFAGRVTIDLNATEKIDNPWAILHIKYLTVIRVTFSSKKSGILEILPKNWRFCERTDQTAFFLPQNLARGQVTSLYVEFRGNISEKLDGLYKSSYLDKNDGSTRKLAVTQFEPTYARQMLPCFDEPAFKAHFLVTVAHQPNYRALSNSPLNSSVTKIEKKSEKSLVEETFEKTVKMSTYLLAIVVSDYKHKSANTSAGVLVSVHAPAYQINQTDWSLNVSVRALEFFDSFFGVPYPLKKLGKFPFAFLDLISINDFQAGAMENWGLITFRDSLFLYDPSKSTLQSKETIASVIVHEIAHQWFGNLVTMKWWSDLWLNEGFADFMQIFVTDALQPDWNLMSTFVSSNLADAQSLDGLVNTHAVSSNISDPAEIESVFDAISYSKGSSMLRSLMTVVGLENLKTALHEYLTIYKYANAEKSDLWRVLNKHSKSLQSGVSIEDFMNCFTEFPGYPLVEARFKNGKLYANQTRFYYSLSAFNDVKTQELWYIPLTLKTLSTKSIPTFWVEKVREASFDTGLPESPWFKVNVDKTGFYRVNYEPENWLQLFNALRQDSEILSAPDRAGLFDDAFALLALGKVKFDWLLDFLEEFLPKEKSRGCWSVFQNEILSIDSNLRDSEVYMPFRRFMARILLPIYQKTSWNLKLGNHEESFVHKLILKMSCYFNVEGCRKHAAENFEKYIVDGQKMDSELRALSCGHAVRNNSNGIFDKVFTLYNTSDVPSEKSDFLACLAQTHSYWRLNRLMSYTLDPTIVKSSLIGTVLGSICLNNPYGPILTWKFFRENYGRIKQLVQPPTMAKIIRVFNTLHSEFDYKQMTDFFKNEELLSSKPVYEQTRERIKINIQFLKLNEPDLILYFKNRTINRSKHG